MRFVPGLVFATHDVDVGRHEVVKRFRLWARDEHRREWHALTLLAAYAPGLAPTPLGCDLDSAPPYVRMSRVPGEPLAARAVTAASLEAAAAAVSRLHAAVPADVLVKVPQQPWLASGTIGQLQSSAAVVSRPDGADRVVQAAFDGAMHWLRLVSEPDPAGFTPVLGQGDGNFANYLWDGHQVRLVDFEDSGRSDRAFELAVIAEHLSVWHDAKVAADTFLGLCHVLGQFDPTRAEAKRLLFFRRAFAVFWLLKLLGSDEDRPSTLREQALRLLSLLDRSEQ
jgi:Ser/Thr protein kinase RdoA (MazF antagonist)